MSRAGNDTPWMGPLPAARGCDCHICRPDDAYDELDRHTIDTVLKHGWQVILVGGDAGCSHPDHDDPWFDDHDEPGPAFAYTVGLGHRCGHPELLMSGLDHRVLHSALNDVAQRVIDGRRLAPGDALEDVLAGVPVAIEQVDDDALEETVTWSAWFHRRPQDALALVWPDRSGIFAWQPGAEEMLDDLQPREWRVPIDHTGGLASDPEWTFPVPPDHRAFSCSHVVDDGEAVLWAARQSDEERGEDWTIHCGEVDHETRDMRVVHLAHLVRSAPSLRAISDLGFDEEALRADTDSPWATARLCP
ncbi:DUF4262 domain-containing protein [Nocardioides sp. LMS-CY]|uniref:DUF4262 domain-containing protein n=1 Tax=Nocardioides sp. (strain LMS-CY) TaxID=2840457 RepID=UPI001C0020B7|nr:DUF4262 domain-containing protein [Nocardioides sp. LMS-CY]QWF20515.1 DUF4262 domain-containing protein [Nocardioides sp. LMS-CY]